MSPPSKGPSLPLSLEHMQDVYQKWFSRDSVKREFEAWQTTQEATQETIQDKTPGGDEVVDESAQQIIRVTVQAARPLVEDVLRGLLKYGGYPIAVTQSVEVLLKDAESRTMVSNSEFVVMLKQSYRDMVEIQKMLHLSDDQAGYIQNVPQGNGLIKWSNNVIPFDMTWPDTGSELYQMFTTKPKEMIIEE